MFILCQYNRTKNVHNYISILVYFQEDNVSVFKEELESKRMIFNVRGDLANRLLWAKEEARTMGKRLDVETPINKAIEKFLQKAEKRIKEEKKKQTVFLQAPEKKMDNQNPSDSQCIDHLDDVIQEHP